MLAEKTEPGVVGHAGSDRLHVPSTSLFVFLSEFPTQDQSTSLPQALSFCLLFPRVPFSAARPHRLLHNFTQSSPDVARGHHFLQQLLFL